MKLLSFGNYTVSMYMKQTLNQVPKKFSSFLRLRSFLRFRIRRFKQDGRCPHIKRNSLPTNTRDLNYELLSM